MRAVKKNHTKRALISVLTSAILSISSVSSADDSGPDLKIERDGKEFRDKMRELNREHRRERREMLNAHRQQAMLERVDSNKDGQIDLNEYLSHAEQRFAKLDVDGNGVVTQEEAQESMQKMREEHLAKRKAMRERRSEARRGDQE